MAYESASEQVAPAFFDDLVRCETRLYNAVNETLRAEHGIAASQFELLRRLARLPGSRVIDIADAFAAGVGAISKGIDRMEAQGWVRRHPNPNDGRSSLVSLTPEGEQLVADAERSFRSRLAALIPLAPAELEAVTAALSRLRASLEADRVGLPVG